MAEEQEKFERDVQILLDVVIFENWLRFYFIAEEKNGADNEDAREILRIAIPGQAMEKIESLYPELYPLAKELNGREVDFESSKRAVLTYVLDNIENKKMAPGVAKNVLSSKTFQIKLQLFNVWTQLHEEQLDQHFLNFGKWRELFTQWLNGPKAQELKARLEDSGTI